MNFDVEIGLKNLKELLRQRYNQPPTDFELLETRLQENLNERRKYGDSPTNLAERNKITDNIISFTREHLDMSFNDLCYARPKKIVPSNYLNSIYVAKDVNTPIASPSNAIPVRYGTKNRWAVLVGVGTYKDASPLPACVNDTQAIAHQLYENGFQDEYLRVLVDDAPNSPTRNNIITTLRNVAKATQPDDLLLFYYTGHGATNDNADESYLLTGDGYFGSLEETALQVSIIKKIMKDANARAKVMILDACRDKIDSSSKGPETMFQVFIDRVFENAKGMVILSSCEHGQRSYIAEDQGHSVYTNYLLEALQGLADRDHKGFVSVGDIHTYVSNTVRRWSVYHNKSLQTPIINTEEMAGEIKVCNYKQTITTLSLEQVPDVSPPAQISRPLSHPTKPWKETDLIQIKDRSYMLYDAGVKETRSSDHSAIWRKAKALDLDTNRPVLLKQVSILKPTNISNELHDILIKEHRLLLQLEPHNVFPHAYMIDESESTSPHITIVYDGLTGLSLQETFGPSGLPLGQASIAQLLRRIIPLCRALGELHRQDCAHRSLSPDNIIIPERGSEARLQDLGLAVWRYKQGEGIAPYQAPEQLTQTNLTLPGPHTDVYQLGAILYFLITGQLRSASTPGSKPSTYNQAVSPKLDAALIRAVALQPKERLNIYEFSQALRQAIG